MCDLYVNVHKQLKGDNFNNIVTGLDDTYCRAGYFVCSVYLFICGILFVQVTIINKISIYLSVITLQKIIFKKNIIQKIPCEMVTDADIICLKVCILERKNIFLSKLLLIIYVIQ